jgi:uncharacterized membrane protein
MSQDIGDSRIHVCGFGCRSLLAWSGGSRRRSGGLVVVSLRDVAEPDGHTHAHRSNHPLTEAERAERRMAVRILAVVLVPAAILTAVGLVWLWPGDVADHVREGGGTQFAAPGVSFPSGTVTDVKEMSCQGLPGSAPGPSETCATLTVRVDEGEDAGHEAEVPISSAIYRSGVNAGDGIVLVRVPTQGPPAFQFFDFERSLPLGAIALAFAIAVVAVARFRGLAAIVGLGFAYLILGKFMLPGLLTGESPVLYALVGSTAIMFVVLYAAHGFSARTTTALAGTLFGLLVTALLGLILTDWANLTGAGSEDDFILASAAPDLKLSTVVMTGVIVAGLGVLNDVTITQASAVWELHESSPDMDAGRLFTRAMRIGRDHIASTVYTIAFATAGAALPVLLLIYVYDRPLLDVLQSEAISEEITRTLIGSIGLVLAVPLTTAVGVAVTRHAGPRTPPRTRRRHRSTRRSFDSDW